MKKSNLNDLFSEESDASDKSLLTYRKPHQPAVDRMTDSVLPAASSFLSSTPAKKTPNEEPSVMEKPQAHCSQAGGQTNSHSADPIPSSSDAGGAPELLHSCVVSAFTFSGSQSVPLGSLGCALYWHPNNQHSILLLYRSRKQQVCLLTLTPASLPAIQSQLYVSFQCDAGRRFSIHLASQPVLREFTLKAVLAAALSSARVDGCRPVALPLLTEDAASSSLGGRRARSGDSLDLEVTEWAVQSPRSETLRQRGGAGTVAGTLDSSWRAALCGATQGERWVVGDPASPELVREVLMVSVRPPPRQAPLHLAEDDGSDWRPGDEKTSRPPEAPSSPPPSPSLPTVDVEQAANRGNADQDSDVRDAPEEGDEDRTAMSKDRRDVLARMARLGQQMFPAAAGAARDNSPSPPPSPARHSTTLPKLQTSSSSTSATAVVATVEGTEDRKVCTGPRPAIASRPSSRPAAAARPDATELGVLLGRLEVKLETVLSRLEPPRGVDASAEMLAAGVRKLATENAALREASSEASRAAEARLEAERSRTAMATELGGSLAELAETKRKLAETQRRLAAAEEAASEAATAATRREAELETYLDVAKSAAAAAAAAAAARKRSVESVGAMKEVRRVLKGVYKMLRSRLPAERTFTGAEVGELVADVVRETLQRLETETVTGRAGTPAPDENGDRGERGTAQTSPPPPAADER